MSHTSYVKMFTTINIGVTITIHIMGIQVSRTMYFRIGFEERGTPFAIRPLNDCPIIIRLQLWIKVFPTFGGCFPWFKWGLPFPFISITFNVLNVYRFILNKHIKTNHYKTNHYLLLNTNGCRITKPIYNIQVETIFNIQLLSTNCYSWQQRWIDNTNIIQIDITKNYSNRQQRWIL